MYPKDSNLTAVLGPDYFQILKIQDSNFTSSTTDIKKLPKKKDACIYTDAVWCDSEKIALSNSIGEIFIIQENEVK